MFKILEKLFGSQEKRQGAGQRSGSDFKKLSDNYVCIDFENEKTGEVLTLNYRLFDNDFTRKWFTLFDITVLQSREIFNDGEFYGADFDDHDEIISKLKQSIKIFNDYSKKMGFEDRLDFEPHKNMSKEFLVELHDRFEDYVHNKDFVCDKDVQNALMDLNIYIHRAENFLPDMVGNGAHVECLIYPVLHIELEEEDYQHFTTDLNWGHLYVTYGISGQPTLNAYYGKSTPRPQDSMSGGMQLSFFNDLPFPKELHDDCRKYLWDNFKMNMDDPRSALGFLHLGVLDIDVKDRKKFMNKLKKYKKIKQVRRKGKVTYPLNELEFILPGASGHVKQKWDENKDYSEFVNREC